MLQIPLLFGLLVVTRGRLVVGRGLRVGRGRLVVKCGSRV